MWFVNPPIADWHRRRFPAYADRIRVVSNGWDPRFLDVTALAKEATAQSEARERLVYSYIGTVNITLPLRLLAEGWRAARRQSEVLARSELRIVGQIGHDGYARPEQEELMAEFAGHGLVFTGRLPKHQVGSAYAGSDVLVFAKEGADFVTSGKVYEYVATGAPVVSVLGPEHDARRVLTGYPRLHDAVAATPAALADAMLAAVDDARGGDALRPAAQAHGAAFRRDVVLSRALDDVEQALAS
jgi:glycosyltransferase involved in cell wall biosynthesis